MVLERLLIEETINLELSMKTFTSTSLSSEFNLSISSFTFLATATVFAPERFVTAKTADG